MAFHPPPLSTAHYIDLLDSNVPCVGLLQHQATYTSADCTALRHIYLSYRATLHLPLLLRHTTVPLLCVFLSRTTIHAPLLTALHYINAFYRSTYILHPLLLPHTTSTSPTARLHVPLLTPLHCIYLNGLNG